ncbi:MAG: SpoIID/LytB domain-containing protein [Acidimicrobiales bacterium]
MMSSKKWRRAIALAIVLSSMVTLVGPVSARTQSTTNPTTITVRGGGWGHGVGMSQYGAYGRAANGDTHEQILGFYYPGSVLTKVDTLDDLRVHIQSAEGTIVTPNKDADLEIVDSEGNLIFNHRNGKRLTIRRVPGSFTVVRANTTGGRNLCIAGDGTDRCKGREIRIRFAQGEPIKVDAINRVSIGSTGNSYQWGELIISRRSIDPTRTLWVVLGGLTMDQYIYGLAEVPASWPSETLQAQAVAGRTYGYDRATSRRVSKNWTHPWDLYSTVDDQVYNGLAKEIGPFGPPWTQAVDATSGEVLLHNGEPITAFYSSSNGGFTEDSGYVFAKSLPYLQPARDTEDDFQNPFASWTRDYTGKELGQWLANSSVGGVGSVKNVKISGNVGASGRVDRATVTITGSKGTMEITGSQFRNVINAGVVAAGGGLSRQVLSTKYVVRVTGGSDPVGAIDVIKRRGETVRVTGWVFDPDSASPVEVQIRVDDAVVETITAGQSRFDIDAVFGQGTSRGYDTRITVGPGAHQVCVYAQNIFGTGRMLLGCKVV